MKIKKLKSPTDLIKEDIEFKDGINIIKGAYDNEQDRENDRNGIGKSSIVRLLDFALMSDSGHNKYFNPEKWPLFEGHKIELEFSHEGETYVIQRSMDNPGEPKFGKKDQDLRSFEAAKDLKFELGHLIFPKFDGDYGDSFRNLVSFFVKDDTDQKKRDEAYKISNNPNTTPNYIYCLYLMDIPNNALRRFDELRKEKDELQNEKTDVSDRLEKDTGKTIEQARASLNQIKNEVSDIENIIESKNFLDGYKDIQQEIEDLTEEISKKVNEINELRSKLSEIEESYDYDVEIKKKEIEKIYDEVDSSMASFVERELDEVIEMREKLSNNRENFLEKKEEELNEKLDDKIQEVSKLEKERSKYYSYLDEEKALDSFESNYDRLASKRSEKDKLENYLEQIDELQKQLNKLNTEISEVKDKLFDDIQSSQDIRGKLQGDFSEFITDVTRVNKREKIILDISTNTGNSYPFKLTVDVPKKFSDGKQQLKNVGFDITIFKNIIESKRTLPRFLVHDGAFKGADKLSFLRSLNYMERLFRREGDFQYIVTANEEDLSTENDLKVEFDEENCTIITLRDNKNDMLFQQEYDT